MCFFRAPSAPAPIEVGQAPPPIAPTNPQTADNTPAKKELVDPDKAAGVQTASSKKRGSALAKGGEGASALRIKVNTGPTGSGGVGSNTGNVA